VSLTRRRFLQVGALTALAVPLIGCEPRPVHKAGTANFGRRLPIPPLAPARRDGAGRRAFDLTAAAGRSRFFAGRSTDTWGFNGAYLGPTLRAARGETVLVNVHNKLPETTTVHWHGMHLPARYDGNPHEPIDPGQTWSPTWTIAQPATTLWYHPHPDGATERHVYRGLAGLFILDGADEAALGLPHRYGVDDIPVIVQDKRFHEDGSLDESDHRPTGLLGDTILVNGAITPHLPVGTEHVRLRLLNASTARIYSFTFADARSFALIGTDGGLLSATYETDRIQLSPAERAEIVVRMRPGERVVLRSAKPDLGTPHDMTTEVGGLDTFDIIELRAAGTLRPSRPLPGSLVEMPRLDPAAAATTRSFQLLEHTINGKQMDMDRIDEVVTVDTVEVWDVVNQDAMPHSFHVHDVRFQVVTIDGAPPPPPLAGWKDTVYLPPGLPIRLVMRFADYTDSMMPYMYHCHLMFHEDMGMMGQFVVVQSR
jgi:FtsP/CotA-like multicopper oxidase with cupredoxin domain